MMMKNYLMKKNKQLLRRLNKIKIFKLLFNKIKNLFKRYNKIQKKIKKVYLIYNLVKNMLITELQLKIKYSVIMKKFINKKINGKLH